ncbi:dihydrolipoamide acetyltransferase family protein [Phytohabitans flavus]|uniref:Dihydrolipoamide acetyltransferase component of pyruvate dehydrogenase complex n=1 Tax=Phytohabitans flavus TaxID=1076124 RepID=A0A6F8Y3F3_9ACTN|nr:dihydrolipoamide acetyltransferase family protein [Phytohabitans flavus]BCB80501.1 dihydrolipoamide acetyltransferase component of pyruvate dehydrogenase complex [Phytohabitans flavus]
MSRIKEFPLPDLGEGLVEGEILKWLVAVGDTIELNQPIVEVETAKAAVEIPAKWAGKVHAIHHEEGTTVEVGVPIISIDTDPGAGEPAEPERTPVLVGYGPRTGAASRRPRRTNGSTAAVSPPPVVVAPAPPPPPPVVEAPAPPARALAKPPVRKFARDLGVDLTGLVGTGPQGSITRDDVQAAVSAPAAAPALAPDFAAGREQRIPIKGVRKLTAENMVSSAFTAPHVTVFLTIDMTRSMEALDRLRALPEWREVRISPLLLVAKAVLLAVGRHPLVNSTWAGDEIIVKQYVNLGIAAATERGLIVPNIKDAGRLPLRELADAMTALVQTAKSGRTAPADMSGGTFTITNVGVFGVDTGTPILPPGESAILAFGAVRAAPWVHEGEIRVRQVTTLGLSFDHRIIDGELGAKFLRDVGAFLTDPEASLLAWT